MYKRKVKVHDKSQVLSAESSRNNSKKFQLKSRTSFAALDNRAAFPLQNMTILRLRFLLGDYFLMNNNM